MTRTRILFVDQSEQLGGAELSLFDLAVGLTDFERTVCVFGEGPFSQKLRGAGVRVEVIDSGQSLSSVAKVASWRARFASVRPLVPLVARLARLSRDHDLLWANSVKAFVASALAGAFARKPVVWHLRDLLTLEHFDAANIELLVFLANRIASSVIANSNATAAAFVAAGGNRSIVRTIHNGIDPSPYGKLCPERLSLLRAELASRETENRFLIGVVGRVAKWKGQTVAVNAVATLPDVQVAIIGDALFSEQADKAEVERLIAARGLQHRVRMLGFRSDIAGLIAACDAIVHCSIAPEPFGRVIVEAMLARTPVIASDAGGVPEIVEHERSGLLVRPGDVASLASAIARLRDDPALRTRLRDNAFRRANERFVISRVLSEVAEHVRQVSLHNRPRSATNTRTPNAHLTDSAPFAALRTPSVLFVDQSGQLGGAELCLLDFLKQTDLDAEAVTFDDGPFVARLRDAGVPTRLLRAAGSAASFRRHWGPAAQLLSAPGALPLVHAIARLARDRDLVYANSQKAFVVCALATSMVHRPLIWHLHDMLTAEHFSGANRRLVIGLANRTASRVIANSRATRDAFIKAGGRQDIVSVIYNGICAARFDAVDRSEALVVRAALGVTDKHRLLGLFGRLALWKGQEIAIEAIARLPACYHLALVGDALFGEEDVKGRIIGALADPRLAGRVHYMGFRDDIPTVMNACDAVLHCSTAPEPFGRVIVEAMLARRPVVASNAGGAREIITDGQTGWLIAPGDPTALASAVGDVFENPQRTRTIVSQARTRAERAFTPARAVAQTHCVLGNAVARRRPR